MMLKVSSSLVVLFCCVLVAVSSANGLTDKYPMIELVHISDRDLLINHSYQKEPTSTHESKFNLEKFEANDWQRTTFKSERENTTTDGVWVTEKIRFSQLTPNTQYKLSYTITHTVYGEKAVQSNRLGSKEFTTKLTRPQFAIVQKPITVIVDGSNASAYYAKVTKVKNNANEPEVAYQVQSAGSDNKLSLPDLVPGANYKLDTWYEDSAGKPSELSSTVIAIKNSIN